MPAKAHLVRAAIYLALLLSPVGAPLVGLAIAQCPQDALMEPSGPFAMGFSYCGVSRPIEQLYQQATFLSTFPVFLAGPVIGGIIAAAWWIIALGMAIGFAWHSCRTLSSAMFAKKEVARRT